MLHYPHQSKHANVMSVNRACRSTAIHTESYADTSYDSLSEAVGNHMCIINVDCEILIFKKKKVSSVNEDLIDGFI